LIREFICLSYPDLVQKAFGASKFQNKSRELMHKIKNNHDEMRQQQQQQQNNLSTIFSYFNTFIYKIINGRTTDDKNTIDLVIIKQL